METTSVMLSVRFVQGSICPPQKRIHLCEGVVVQVCLWAALGNHHPLRLVMSGFGWSVWSHCVSLLSRAWAVPASTGFYSVLQGAAITRLETTRNLKRLMVVSSRPSLCCPGAVVPSSRRFCVHLSAWLQMGSPWDSHEVPAGCPCGSQMISLGFR